MSIKSVLKDSVATGKAVKVSYNGKIRLFSPTELVETTGNPYVIGLEAEGCWKRYSISKIASAELSSVPSITDEWEVVIASF